MATPSQAAMEILHRLKSTEPPVWLAPNPSLSQEARTASRHLFSSLRPFCPKSPFEQLLIDGFDSEQIWQQIDVQTHNMISGLPREVRHFEKNPDEISRFFGESKKAIEVDEKGSEKNFAGENESEDLDDLDDMDVDGFDEDEEVEEMEKERRKGGIEDGEESRSEEGEGDKEDEEEEGKGGGGIEDGFLKIKELEEYLEEDEAREYGIEAAGKSRKKEKRAKRKHLDGSSGEDDEHNVGEDEDEDEESDEVWFVHFVPFNFLPLCLSKCVELCSLERWGLLMKMMKM